MTKTSKKQTTKETTILPDFNQKRYSISDTNRDCFEN